MVSEAVTTILGSLLSGLTPLERWEAVRRLGSNVVTERWFVVAGLITMLGLTVLLLLMTFTQRRQQQTANSKSFAERADEWGLSDRERQVLLSVAARAGLKRSESIFTMAAGFDQGAAKVIEEDPNVRGTGEGGEQMKMELSFLREKLGFRRRRLLHAAHSSGVAKLSSRQIPVGKELHITRRHARDSGDIKVTVARNTEAELCVKLAAPVRVTFGEIWCVRYYCGASVWEFDTSVVSYDGDMLVLNHSEKVRFVNRRRFFRAAVGMRAFVARFPFTRVLGDSGNAAEQHGGDDRGSNASGEPSEPPVFVPAVVTELAGPGLRIESRLKAEAGDRILVVFRLDAEEGADPTGTQGGDRSARFKIVQDIGEIRHVQTTENGSSIAVELTGLSDPDIDELIRATNAALLKAHVGSADTPGRVKHQEPVGEPSAVIAEGVRDA